MQFTDLSDEALHESNLDVVKSEREILNRVLHHLRESERRRLYSKYKCPSLKEYAMKYFGYSEDEAIRRIGAMRLLKELPQIEAKIESGALTVTHLIKARAVFRKEKKASLTRSQDQKLDLLSKLENSTQKEAEKTLATEAFVEIQPRSAPLKLDQFNERVRKKLERLLEVTAHTNADSDLEVLIEKMADQCLQRWDPVEKAKRAKNEKNASQRAPKNAPKNVLKNALTRFSEKSARFIPAAVKHAVYMRDSGRCRNCGSGRATEIDHVIPLAQGGTYEVSNLRLLCRSCNIRHAIETYGSKKMESYVRAPQAHCH